MPGLTPSQTVGPFFAYCLTPKDYSLQEIFSSDLMVPGLEGQKIRIEGRVIDGDGVGIPDAVVEIWQADAAGTYAHAEGRPAPNVAFKGFGRCGTGKDGEYQFTTIKPGRVKDPKGNLQAPHLAVTILARGLLKQLTTRVYFADEASNTSDPILALVPQERRETLLAKPQKNGAETVYAFDFRLQEGSDGQPETVFFEG